MKKTGVEKKDVSFKKKKRFLKIFMMQLCSVFAFYELKYITQPLIAVWM